MQIEIKRTFQSLRGQAITLDGKTPLTLGDVLIDALSMGGGNRSVRDKIRAVSIAQQILDAEDHQRKTIDLGGADLATARAALEYSQYPAIIVQQTDAALTETPIKESTDEP